MLNWSTTAMDSSRGSRTGGSVQTRQRRRFFPDTKRNGADDEEAKNLHSPGPLAFSKVQAPFRFLPPSFADASSSADYTTATASRLRSEGTCAHQYFRSKQGCGFRNVGQNIGCVDHELRFMDGWADLCQFLARSQGAGGGLVLAGGCLSGSLGKPRVWRPRSHPLTPNTTRPQEIGDETAGQGRGEVNKPRNQPRRGGATCLPCLIGAVEAPHGAGDLEIKRCEGE